MRSSRWRSINKSATKSYSVVATLIEHRYSIKIGTQTFYIVQSMKIEVIGLDNLQTQKEIAKETNPNVLKVVAYGLLSIVVLAVAAGAAEVVTLFTQYTGNFAY